jgi:hypothetical protein
MDPMSPRYSPIQSGILSYLSAPDVAMVTRTFRSLSTLWKTFVATQYNINAKLSAFFKNPRQFRTIRAQTDAIIIEDVAQELFE